MTVESVETEAEAAAILAAGADVLQGYLFGRPMHLSDFISWAKGRDGRQSQASA